MQLVQWLQLGIVTRRALVTALVPPLLLAGCSIRDAAEPRSGNGSSRGAGQTGLAGVINVNGSSTVFPITRAVAEKFHALHRDVKPQVGTSGTGSGFDLFARGEIDINDASRPIKQTEADRCAENGIEFIELKIAIDGLSVMVHPENGWCDCLSVEELRAIWHPDSNISKWSEVNSDWPDEEIILFGPDTQSGTFDYFTEEICGEAGASRPDYTPSKDDNVLVRGISEERGALGYFGYAYYVENQDSLKLVGVSPEGESGNCVIPTAETIESGVYRPLSRPLFLYVSKSTLNRPEMRQFLNFYLQEGQDLVSEVGYVRLSESVLAETRQILADAIDAATGGGDAGSSEDSSDSEEGDAHSDATQ